MDREHCMTKWEKIEKEKVHFSKSDWNLVLAIQKTGQTWSNDLGGKMEDRKRWKKDKDREDLIYNL